jgi:outer membrane protein TolC
MRGAVRACESSGRRGAALLLALAALAPREALAEPRPTRTLEECVQVALDRHPRLGSAQAGVEAGRQRVRQQRAGYLPQLEAGGSSQYRKTSPGQATGLPGGASSERFGFYTVGLSLSQVLFDFGRNLDAIQAAQARREALEADAVTEREIVVRDVKQAYFDLLAARRLLGVAEEVLRSNRRQLDEAHGRYEVGFTTKLDVTRSEVLVANAELDLLAARNATLVAEQTLRNAMGLDAPLDFDPVDVLETRRVEIDEEQALAIALESRPELLSLRALRSAADEEASSRWKEHLPELAGAATTDWSGSDRLSNTWDLGAEVRVPIFAGGATSARVGEARADALALGFEEHALRQDVALEVRQAFLELARAREAIGVSARVRDQARENLELAEGRYRTGVGNVIELADAQAQRASGEAEYVRSLYGYQIAVADLERAIGRAVALP